MSGLVGTIRTLTTTEFQIEKHIEHNVLWLNKISESSWVLSVSYRTKLGTSESICVLNFSFKTNLATSESSWVLVFSKRTIIASV